MDSSPDFGKLLGIAIAKYNAANPTTPVTIDTAARALVNLLQAAIATGNTGATFAVASLTASPVTAPI